MARSPGRDGYRGTTALVTGASQGLGAALASGLARRGAGHLVPVARSGAALEQLAGRLRADHDVRVTPLAVDLTDPAAPGELVAELDRRGIRPDLLVNNAGRGTVGPFLDSSLRAGTDAVAVNVTALLALTRLIGARMVADGRGGIINVGSTAAFQSMPYQASYAATKAFVLSFTEALAEELRGTGVRVMASHPGPIATGFFDGTTATMKSGAAEPPERIAARTLDAFTRGAVNAYPGRALFRAMTWLSRPLPRTATVRINGRFNRYLGLDRARDLHTSSAG